METTERTMHDLITHHIPTLGECLDETLRRRDKDREWLWNELGWRDIEPNRTYFSGLFIGDRVHRVRVSYEIVNELAVAFGHKPAGLAKDVLLMSCGYLPQTPEGLLHLASYMLPMFGPKDDDFDLSLGWAMMCGAMMSVVEMGFQEEPHGEAG